MKKAVSAVLIFVMLLLCVGCTGVLTDEYHAEKETYYAGETIKIYDDETAAQLATLRITNVTVVRDEPYICETFLCSLETYESSMKNTYDGEVIIKGDSVYKQEEFAGVVQIDFVESTVDSTAAIKVGNFYISDCNGDSVDRNVQTHYETNPTSDNSFVVGVREIGDLELSFSFNTSWTTTCTIICEYESITGAYNIMEDEYEDMTCPSCGKYRDAVDAYCRHCGEKLK